MKDQNQSRSLALGLTVLSALGRLVPHAPNVTPLGGSCLFAGSRLAGPIAYLLPLVVMVATDPLAWFGHGYTLASPVIYLSFMLSVWIGRCLLKNVTPIRVGSAAFLCSLQFFVFSNLALWVGAVAGHSTMYSADFAGLVKCYTMALPFFGRTLAGDLLFSGAIFGMYELLSRASSPTSSKQDVRATA